MGYVGGIVEGAVSDDDSVLGEEVGDLFSCPWFYLLRLACRAVELAHLAGSEFICLLGEVEAVV